MGRLFALACLGTLVGVVHGKKRASLPHGLLPSVLVGFDKEIHERVERLAFQQEADEDAEAEACSARLAHLRSLVADGQCTCALRRL